MIHRTFFLLESSEHCSNMNRILGVLGMRDPSCQHQSRNQRSLWRHGPILSEPVRRIHLAAGPVRLCPLAEDQSELDVRLLPARLADGVTFDTGSDRCARQKRPAHLALVYPAFNNQQGSSQNEEGSTCLSFFGALLSLSKSPIRRLC